MCNRRSGEQSVQIEADRRSLWKELFQDDETDNFLLCLNILRDLTRKVWELVIKDIKNQAN